MDVLLFLRTKSRSETPLDSSELSLDSSFPLGTVELARVVGVCSTQYLDTDMREGGAPSGLRNKNFARHPLWSRPRTKWPEAVPHEAWRLHDAASRYLGIGKGQVDDGMS